MRRVVEQISRLALGVVLAFGMTALLGCPPPEEDEDAGTTVDAGPGADAGEEIDAGEESDAATGQDIDSTTTGTIAGTVTDILGNGVGDALVSAGGQSVNADYQGIYTLAGVPAGDVSVTFSADWFEELEETGVTVAVGASTTLDVTLAALPLAIDAADRTLAETYNGTFDWSSDTVAVGLVDLPTRAEIDKALYFQNPALYPQDIGLEPTVTPVTPIDLSGGAAGFDFPLQAGSANEGDQALEVATIVDTLAETPLTSGEIDASMLWEPAIDIYMVNNHIMEALELYYVSLAVRGQRYDDPNDPNDPVPSLAPQHLQHAYVHGGTELWVELAFEDFLTLDASITDSNGDGWREVFARVPTAYYDGALLTTLTTEYVDPTFDTLGLRDGLNLILDDLYTRTSPEIVSTIGVPYELTGTGTFVYPAVVLEHSNAKVNVLLVAPAP